MARIPRKLLFDPAEVGVYHGINRCVRRARLMGDDPYTGQSYDHRKEWLVGRMSELAGMMACEFLGFSAMDNHFHVIVRNRIPVTPTSRPEESPANRRILRKQNLLRTARSSPNAPDL